MIHFGLATTPDVILDAITKRIVTNGGFTSDSVFPSLATDEQHAAAPPGDCFVTITPGRFPLDGATFAGAGRYNTGFNGAIRIAVLARYASDQEFRSTRLLTEKTRNILTRFLGVLDALSGFCPEGPPNDDGQKTCILREPMRVESFEVLPRQIKVTPWAVVASTWQIRFTLAMPGGPTPGGT